MSFVLKYQQSVYEKHISLLEGHLNRLQRCYEEMEKLKGEMSYFWNDENAREAKKLLDETMRRVKNEKNRADKMLAYYSSTVTYISGANDAISDLAQEAFSALSNLGGLM